MPLEQSSEGNLSFSLFEPTYIRDGKTTSDSIRKVIPQTVSGLVAIPVVTPVDGSQIPGGASGTTAPVFRFILAASDLAPVIKDGVQFWKGILNTSPLKIASLEAFDGLFREVIPFTEVENGKIAVFFMEQKPYTVNLTYESE